MDSNLREPLVTDSAFNPYAAPTSTSTTNAAPAAESPPSLVTATRIAGAMLLAAVPAALISTRDAHGVGSYLGILVDVLLGISFARGNLKYRPAAVVRCLIGLLFYGGQALSKGDVAGAVGIAVFTATLLLLLLGTPGKARTIVGGVVGGLLTVLTYMAVLAGGGD